MDGAWLGAAGVAIGALITVVVAAYISVRKAAVETDKTVRNGVLEEWREIADKLQASHTVCVGRTQALEAEVKALRLEHTEEVKVLRLEITKLYGELASLRKQISARETERVDQLEQKVVALKTPDTQALAEAIAPKIVEALADKNAAVEPEDGLSKEARDQIAGRAKLVQHVAADIEAETKKQ